VRISTRGRYSLEALLYLALLQEGEFASTRAISEQTGISERYLEQLFIPLRGRNILTGIRGPKGGYFLGQPADEITVGAILRAVEGPMEIVECVDNTLCPRKDVCASRHTWSELYQEIISFVDAVTLADLAKAYNNQGGGDYSI
jgi:Rrf2 family protein